MAPFCVPVVEISLAWDRGRVVALECEGHAGFDDGEGLDLVCSAVSALTGALGLGLVEKAVPPLKVKVGDGHFAVNLADQSASEEARFLLDTIGASLLLLGRHYPGFVHIKQVEK